MFLQKKLRQKSKAANIVGLSLFLRKVVITKYTGRCLSLGVCHFNKNNNINNTKVFKISLTRFYPALGGRSPVSIQNNFPLVHCKPLAFPNPGWKHQLCIKLKIWAKPHENTREINKGAWRQPGVSKCNPKVLIKDVQRECKVCPCSAVINWMRAPCVCCWLFASCAPFSERALCLLNIIMSCARDRTPAPHHSIRPTPFMETHTLN